MRIARRNAIRGTDIRTFPFFVKLHTDLSRASSIFFRASLALSKLLEKVSKTSWRLLASGCESSGLPYCPAPLRRDAARQGRNVQGQLAQRKGFRVWFPGE